jgi:hypothetical protein
MLEKLGAVQVKALAEKARAAREARDREITGIRDSAFGEPPPVRGPHNPTADLGLNIGPKDESHRKALEDALSAMPTAALRELWALVLVGRGDYGIKDWPRAITEVTRAGVSIALFLEDADLHEHLMKAAYELERM